MTIKPRAPYRIVKFLNGVDTGRVVADQIPTMTEATALMKTLHDMSVACDMVIVDANGRAAKIRRKTGYDIAKTRNIADEPRWQSRVDAAVAAVEE